MEGIYKSREDCGNLRTVALPLGVSAVALVPTIRFLAFAQAQGVRRPEVDLFEIAELVQNCLVFDVVTLVVLGIAEQNSRHLFLGDVVIGTKPPVMVAADDAMVGCPIDRVAVPVLKCHIAEGVTQICLWQIGTACQSVQHGHQHSAGHGVFG